MRNLSNIESYILAKTGTRPINIVEIWWDYNTGVIRRYADRDISDNVDTFIPGSIVTLSGLDSVIKIGGSSTGIVNITLDDTNGSIKSILDTLNPQKRWVHIYQAFDGDTDSRSLLFSGQINSPVVWSEGNRTVSFSVVGLVEASEFGFTPEQGFFENMPDEAVGQAWPAVFGCAKRYKCPLFLTRLSTTSNTIYKIITLKLLADLAAKIKEFVAAEFILTHLTDEIIAFLRNNVDDIKKYEDVLTRKAKAESEINKILFECSETNEAQYADLVQYKNFIMEMERQQQLVVWYNNKLSYYTLVKTNKQIELARADASPQEKIRLQQDITSLTTTINNLTQQINTARAQVTSNKTAADALKQFLITLTLSQIRVDDSSKFPQNCTLRIGNVRLQGSFNQRNIFTVQNVLPTESNLQIQTASNDNQFLLTTDKVIKNQWCLIRKSPTFAAVVYIIDQDDRLCTFQPILYKQNANGKYEPIRLDSTYTIIETSPIWLDSWYPQVKDKSPMESGHRDHETLDSGWEIKVGDRVELDGNYPTVYVANIHSNSTVPDTVYEVVGRRRLRSNREVYVPIPQQYYTIRYNYKIGNMYCTLIVFKEALTTHQKERWYDEVYVSLESNCKLNSGSFVGRNPANVIRYLAEKHTFLTIDSASFNTVAGQLSGKFDCNFVLTKRENVYKLMESIAWQARCALFVRNNVLYIVNLAKYNTVIPTIDSSMIEFGTLEIGTTVTEELETVIRAKFYDDYTKPEKEIVIRNNIGRFGIIEGNHEFFIYNNPETVQRAATFWLIRKSHVWKKIKFKGFLNLLNLEPFDTVLLDLPDLANEQVIGVVENANYDSASNSISFEIWVSVISGAMYQYPAAFPSEIGSEITFPTAYDNYSGGYTDQYSYFAKELNDTNLGIFYTNAPKDRGTYAISDSAAPTQPEPSAGMQQLNYVIPDENPRQDTYIPLIDTHKTMVVDPDTGNQAPLNTIISVRKGEPGIPMGQETADPLFSYVALKNNAMMFGEYFDGYTQPVKQVLASIEFVFDRQLKKWVPNNRNVFLARITGRTLISTNKYKYDWIECDINGNQISEGRRSVSDSHRALNVIEILNDGQQVEGNSINMANYGNLTFQPVGGTPHTDVIVVMFEVMVSGQVKYFFQYENALDGEC